MAIDFQYLDDGHDFLYLVENYPLLQKVASKVTEYDHIDKDDIDSINNVAQTLCDISHYGLQSGFGGFVYDEDLVKFFDENKQLIAETIDEFEQECDKRFCFKDVSTKDIIMMTDQVKIQLVTFAVEMVCCEVCRFE